MITIHIILMSGETIHYKCKRKKAKFTTHKNRMEETILNHLDLDKENYTVDFYHDVYEKLKQEHDKRVEKWIEQEKIVTQETYILPSNFSTESIRSFKEKRDKNRYYEDGSIVRAFVKEFNFKKEWAKLTKQDLTDR